MKQWRGSGVALEQEECCGAKWDEIWASSVREVEEEEKEKEEEEEKQREGERARACSSLHPVNQIK